MTPLEKVTVAEEQVTEDHDHAQHQMILFCSETIARTIKCDNRLLNPISATYLQLVFGYFLTQLTLSHKITGEQIYKETPQAVKQFEEFLNEMKQHEADREK